MRLLTAKGVEDEGRRRGRGGLGKKSSFANERIFRTKRLSWTNRFLRAPLGGEDVENDDEDDKKGGLRRESSLCKWR